MSGVVELSLEEGAVLGAESGLGESSGSFGASGDFAESGSFVAEGSLCGEAGVFVVWGFFGGVPFWSFGVSGFVLLRTGSVFSR